MRMPMPFFLGLYAYSFMPEFALAAETQWHQDPFRIVVRESVSRSDPDESALLDMGRRYSTDDYEPPEFTYTDAPGYAGPYLIDIDGDGRRDLVVGGFSGKYRLYRNIGSDDAPRFSSRFTFLPAGDGVARVPIACCIAPSPFFADLDGDGAVDLLSGGYLPGDIYFFRALGQGRFAARQSLIDEREMPVRDPVRTSSGELDDFSPGATPALVDWNDDGKLDLLIGTLSGRIFVVLNVSGEKRKPLFSSSYTEISIAGKKALPERHATVAVADWDGDGLWDIVSGSNSGAVYWLRNTGKRGAPQFSTREQLIGPGEGLEQWLEPNDLPRRGIRSQVQVVDFNRDGKPDILLGDWSTSMTPRPALSSDERKRMEVLRARINTLDVSVGWDRLDFRHKSTAYLGPDSAQRDPRLKIVGGLRRDLSSFLRSSRSPYLTVDDVSDIRGHGFVWVFLHK